MCGRYASARKRQELLEEFQVRREHADPELPPDYNVAPTKRVYAVLTRNSDHRDGSGVSGPAAPEPAASAAAASEPADPAAREAPREQQAVAPGTAGPERQLRVVRWGLVPFWAKDPAIGSRLINARAETVAEKPSFRRAFARRRCLLPADGYYEWQAAEPDPGKRGARKVPYYIHPSDDGVLALAGLYELWRRPAGGTGGTAGPAGEAGDGPDPWLWTVTIITTRAADELGRIHDRMPMVIERSRWADWLDPARTDPGEVRELLLPAAAGALDAYPVSPDVNNVRNNGPGLRERAPAEVISPRNGAIGSPGSLP
jgi:putative SOS response-associated peptidase YedK